MLGSVLIARVRSVLITRLVSNGRTTIDGTPMRNLDARKATALVGTMGRLVVATTIRATFLFHSRLLPQIRIMYLERVSVTSQLIDV